MEISLGTADLAETAQYLPTTPRSTLGLTPHWRRIAPLESQPSYRIGKRAADLALGAVLLPFIAAIGLIVGLLVKSGSRGPLFYRHRRIGHRGRTFYMWKFRTMRVDGDRILREYLEAHPEAMLEWKRSHKLRNDPRVNSLGQFLRMSSLDELPQILNVLKGDMSLVGPRPIVDEEVEKYGERFAYFIAAKPGITGLWQVSGRCEVEYHERTAFDERYVREWSPWMDMSILARTLKSVWHREGAY